MHTQLDHSINNNNSVYGLELVDQVRRGFKLNQFLLRSLTHFQAKIDHGASQSDLCELYRIVLMERITNVEFEHCRRKTNEAAQDSWGFVPPNKPNFSPMKCEVRNNFSRLRSLESQL